jgi:hypothetical protein
MITRQQLADLEEAWRTYDDAEGILSRLTTQMGFLKACDKAMPRLLEAAWRDVMQRERAEIEREEILRLQRERDHQSALSLADDAVELTKRFQMGRHYRRRPTPEELKG